MGLSGFVCSLICGPIAWVVGVIIVLFVLYIIIRVGISALSRSGD